MKRKKYTKADFAWTRWMAKDFSRIASEMVRRKKLAKEGKLEVFDAPLYGDHYWEDDE